MRLWVKFRTFCAVCGENISRDPKGIHMTDETTHPTYANGKICYIEIPSADVGRSAAFYTKIFGWRTRRRTDGHLAFDDTAGEVSGTWVTGRKAVAATGILIYIMVDNMSLALDAITANGGTVTQPMGMDAPEITARFQDPDGNVFGLYQQPKK